MYVKKYLGIAKSLVKCYMWNDLLNQLINIDLGPIPPNKYCHKRCNVRKFKINGIKINKTAGKTEEHTIQKKNTDDNIQ